MAIGACLWPGDPLAGTVGQGGGAVERGGHLQAYPGPAPDHAADEADVQFSGFNGQRVVGGNDKHQSITPIGLGFQTAQAAASGDDADFDLPGGRHIPIEERDADEFRLVHGLDARGVPSALSQLPAKEAVVNPAFDVTPNRLITALITERGTCPASQAGLFGLYPEEAQRKQALFKRNQKAAQVFQSRLDKVALYREGRTITLCKIVDFEVGGHLVTFYAEPVTHPGFSEGMKPWHFSINWDYFFYDAECWAADCQFVHWRVNFDDERMETLKAYALTLPPDMDTNERYHQLNHFFTYGKAPEPTNLP